MNHTVPSAALRIRLVVFDWDGTLIDSIGAIVDCTYAVLDELELPRPGRDRVLSLIGRGLGDSIRDLAPDSSDELVGRVIDTYRRLWFDHYHSRPPLIKGAEAAVSRLAQDGHLLAVATAKGRRGLDADLERTGLGPRFHSTRTADESASKPSPAMLLELLEELGVRAAEALMVGDSVHDIEMAHNAGVPVVAVASGAQNAVSLAMSRPITCLESVRELPGWLEGRPNG